MSHYLDCMGTLLHHYKVAQSPSDIPELVLFASLSNEQDGQNRGTCRGHSPHKTCLSGMLRPILESWSQPIYILFLTAEPCTISWFLLGLEALIV